MIYFEIRVWNEKGEILKNKMPNLRKFKKYFILLNIRQFKKNKTNKNKVMWKKMQRYKNNTFKIETRSKLP